jgi:Anti-sigma factor NepR
MKEKKQMNYSTAGRVRRGDDVLGPNTDIGMKLRALYGAVQEETIPDKFLELLERLDQAEQKGKSDAAQE